MSVYVRGLQEGSVTILQQSILLLLIHSYLLDRTTHYYKMGGAADSRMTKNGVSKMDQNRTNLMNNILEIMDEADAEDLLKIGAILEEMAEFYDELTASVFIRAEMEQ